MFRYLAFGFLVFSFSACYFNPIVNGILDPAEKATNSSLGLLALGGGGTSQTPSPIVDTVNTDATMQVYGQIKDLSSVNIASPRLSIAETVTTSQREAISTTYTGNASGKFVIKLRAGTFTVSVSNSSGTSLGSFRLIIATDLTVTKEDISGASFIVSGLRSYGINESVPLTVDVPAPTITSFNGSGTCNAGTITIVGTNFSSVPSENTLSTPGCTFGAITASTSTTITTSHLDSTSLGSCFLSVTVGGQTATSSTQFTWNCS